MPMERAIIRSGGKRTDIGPVAVAAAVQWNPWCRDPMLGAGSTDYAVLDVQ